jgi:hypothetical protein
MPGTIPILQARIAELEAQLAEQQAVKVRLQERLAEFRALFRVLLRALEEGAYGDDPTPEPPPDA